MYLDLVSFINELGWRVLRIVQLSINVCYCKLHGNIIKTSFSLPIEDQKSANVWYADNSIILNGMKPFLVNCQYVLHKYKSDQCDADYVGYTSRQARINHMFKRRQLWAPRI